MDKSYLVSARKYRPQRFDELVAQDHVTETLKNAIQLDRLAHAYLFSGPRGVGKTTAARILAKAINCSTPLDERVGAEPCLECDSCLSFDGGRNLNVIEIDAASNNKADDMRELRDTVRVPPQGAAYKVYIIDEVHMLSQSAFNALLKTLEEPPPYALFIFATTEPHKVLPTIQSRCQRFDFRRIDVEVIVEHLKEIAEKESVSVDEASFMLLARKGDGALRDALSAFDQAVSLCGRDIQYTELANAFRVVDVDRYFEIQRCVAEHDSAAMLTVIDELVKDGYDLTELLGGLLGHLRNLLVAVSMGSTDLIEATADVRARYAKSAKAFSEADLLRMMMVVSVTEESQKASRQPRLNVELGLLKLVHLTRVTDLGELVAELKATQLETTATPRSATRPKAAAPAAGANPKAGAAPKASTSTRPDGPTDEVQPEAAPKPRAEAQPAQALQRDLTVEPPAANPKRSTEPAIKKAAKSVANTDEPTNERTDEKSVGDAGSKGDSVSGKKDPTKKAVPAERAVNSPSLFGTPALRATPRTDRTEEPSASTEGSAAVALAAQDPKDRTAVKAVDNIWLAFVRSVKNDRIHVGSLLQHAAPASLDGSTLHVAVPDDFHRRLLTNQEPFLLEHLESHLADEIKAMTFTIRVDMTGEAHETEETFDPLEYMNQKRAESPVVRAIFEEFGGELVW